MAIFGRAGELKVRLETDFPERFLGLKLVCLRPPDGEPRLFEALRARLHKGQALLQLAGIASMEEAEAWRGAWVQVRRRDAVPLEAGSYYRSDLVGMEVVTAAGRVLGKLDRVLPNPGHDLFEVAGTLLPGVKPIVVEVDLANRRIVMDPPAGILPDEEPANAD